MMAPYCLKFCIIILEYEICDTLCINLHMSLKIRHFNRLNRLCVDVWTGVCKTSLAAVFLINIAFVRFLPNSTVVTKYWHKICIVKLVSFHQLSNINYAWAIILYFKDFCKQSQHVCARRGCNQCNKPNTVWEHLL